MVQIGQPGADLSRGMHDVGVVKGPTEALSVLLADFLGCGVVCEPLHPVGHPVPGT